MQHQSLRCNEFYFTWVTDYVIYHAKIVNHSSWFLFYGLFSIKRSHQKLPKIWKRVKVFQSNCQSQPFPSSKGLVKFKSDHSFLLWHSDKFINAKMPETVSQMSKLLFDLWKTYVVNMSEVYWLVRYKYRTVLFSIYRIGTQNMLYFLYLGKGFAVF